MAEKGHVIVKRVFGLSGAAAKIKVLIDDVEVHKLGNGKEAVLSVDPGHHNIKGKATMFLSKKGIDFDLEPGEEKTFLFGFRGQWVGCQEG